MSEPTSDSGFTEIRCRRYGPSAAGNRDAVIVEEPLELRVDGNGGGDRHADARATTGISRSASFRVKAGSTQLRDVEQRGRFVRTSRRRRGRHSEAIWPRHPESTVESGNVVDVRLAEQRRAALRRADHRLTALSSCGVCGKRTIEEVFALTPAPRRAAPVASVGPSTSGSLRCPSERRSPRSPASLRSRIRCSSSGRARSTGPRCSTPGGRGARRARGRGTPQRGR